jgi:hypothetical protein
MQQPSAERAFRRARGLTNSRLGQAQPYRAASKVHLLGLDQTDPELTKLDDIPKRSVSTRIYTHYNALSKGHPS